MAGKRQATYDLNRDNCDDELPHEEAGHWKPASEDDLKSRPKLKARRTVANTSGSAPNLFSGWSFNLAKPATPSLTIPISSGSNGTSNAITTVDGKTESNVGTSEEKSLTSEKIGISTCTSGSNIEERKKVLLEKKASLLKKKEHIEKEIQALELEERQIENTESESNQNDQTKSLTPSETPADEEIELPPEEPWN